MSWFPQLVANRFLGVITKPVRVVKILPFSISPLGLKSSFSLHVRPFAISKATTVSKNGLETVAFLFQENFLESAKYGKKSLLGDKHSEVADRYFSLGYTMMGLEKNEEAANNLLKALEIQSAYLGKDDKDLAPILTSIGKAFHKSGNYPLALHYYDKAYHVTEIALGPQELGQYSYDIGQAFIILKDFARAIEHLIEALTLYRKRGPDGQKSDEQQLELALILFSLGVSHFFQGVYQKTAGEYQKAVDDLQEAHTILRATFGEQHPHVTTALIALANCFYAQKDYEKSASYFTKIIPMLKGHMGEQHFEVGIANRNLGNALLGQKNYPLAKEKYKEALTILQKTRGQDDPETKSIEKDLQYCEKLLLDSQESRG